MKKETMTQAEILKKNLFILFDAMGMLSLQCLCCEFSDVIWAPMAYLMTRMYKGTAGGKWSW
jgi:hypothetical protein